MIMILIHLCKMMISPGVFFHFWGCWGGRKGGRVKGKGIGQNEKNNYICHMPCLRNIGIYGLSSMVHLSKMMISPGAFFIFSKFWFSGLLGEWGRSVWRGKKWSKMRKNFLSCSISQESFVIWFSFIVLIFKMIIPPMVFFHFFKIFIFRVFSGGGGQKIAQDDKKILSVMLDI